MLIILLIGVRDLIITETYNWEENIYEGLSISLVKLRKIGTPVVCWNWALAEIVSNLRHDCF